MKRGLNCWLLRAATAHSIFTGPVSGANYTYRDALDLAATVLSPCDAVSVPWLAG